MLMHFDVEGRHYRVMVESGQVEAITVDASERFGHRSGTERWKCVWRPGRRVPLGRHLKPVMAKAEALMAKFAAASPPPAVPPTWAWIEPAPPPWTGRMTGLPPLR